MKVGIISTRILIRRALSALLASTGTALIVFEGNALLEDLEGINDSRAEILIVDMCGSSRNIDDLARLPKSGLNPKVMLLMDELNSESCARAFQLGAWGCLSTKHNPMTVQKALHWVAKGQRWIGFQPSNPTVRDFVEKRGQNPTQRASEDLTPREWEVLSFLANGCGKKEIADRLFISEETAKSHIKSIYRKLDIKPRRNAVFHYFERVNHVVSDAGVEVESSVEQFASTKPHQD